MPTSKFPVSILQNGVKMTNEPPKGLRSNIKKSYLAFTDDQLDDCTKPEDFKKLVWGLCFFHAIILDRRRFGPLGWNIPYAFTEEDLQVCVTQLKTFIDMYAEIPYTVLNYLFNEINYGGRVTDAIDFRVLSTLLKDYICAETLQDGYKFAGEGLPAYQSIPTGDRDFYLEEIQKLPIDPEPQAFGFHENANITAANQETAALFNTLLEMIATGSSAGGGKSREDILREKADGILDSLPETYDMFEMNKKYPIKLEESMNTVLTQEAMRYNKLLRCIKESLHDLKKALKGELVMTAELELLSNKIFNNQVPGMWENVAYPSTMPLAAWVEDLKLRLAFLKAWEDNGKPSVFWVSGFFFPQAFLTGTKQNFARKYVKPIDLVSFDFEVVETPYTKIKEGPEDGCYIRGLFMEGARWDEKQKSVADSRPKELYVTFPVLWLKPVYERTVPEKGVYRTPCYKILTRQGQLSTTGHSTNFVMWMELPSNVPPSKWIKAGVALFCALNYSAGN